jgi:SAM-dependent methyltransferase
MANENSSGRVYAFGYSPAAVGMMDGRTAAANAGFLLPSLKSGMSVLDIGCGPGSITVGLAEAVAPGETVGVDIEPSQIDLARDRVAKMGLNNCRFEVASVFTLPFPDDTFDVVFGHTILMQFHEIDPVLDEVKRVLKPGGLAAFREIDFGASLFGPADAAMNKVFSTLRRSVLENEGYPDIGRDLPALFAGAGLNILSARPIYMHAPTVEARTGMYRAMTGLWEQADFVKEAIQLGWLTEEERASVTRQLELEAKEPGGISGTTYVEVIGQLSE